MQVVPVGDRVALHDADGTYATHIAIAADKLDALPDAVTAAEGAALGIPIGTAYQYVRSLEVSEGDVLLVHAGSGAVGQAVIQFAVATGAIVVATASPARHDQLRELGAIAIAYGDGLADRVRAALDGRAVTVALDCIGTDEAIEVSKQLVADPQRIATIVRGPDAATLGIRAFSGGSPEPLTAQQLAWRAEGIGVAIDAIANGDFQVELGPELPLADAAEAHRLIEASSARGKIILVP